MIRRSDISPDNARVAAKRPDENSPPPYPKALTIVSTRTNTRKGANPAPSPSPRGKGSRKGKAQVYFSPDYKTRPSTDSRVSFHGYDANPAYSDAQPPSPLPKEA